MVQDDELPISDRIKPKPGNEEKTVAPSKPPKKLTKTNSNTKSKPKPPPVRFDQEENTVMFKLRPELPEDVKLRDFEVKLSLGGSRS